MRYFLPTLSLFMACALPSVAGAQALQNNAPAVGATTAALQPALQAASPLVVEYLGSPRGYSITSAPVEMMCVVKNVSSTPVPAGVYRLQCVPLDGLDYYSGNTIPLLPALQPTQQAYVLWQLKPRDDGHSYASTAILQQLSSPPNSVAKPIGVRIAVFPTLPGVAHFGTPIAGLDKGPQAGFTSTTAWVAANMIAMKVRTMSNREPLALLAGSTNGVWQTCSLLSPFLTVKSGGSGQQPWLQTFRWLNANTSIGAASSSLTLNGTCGKLWEVHMMLTAVTDSSTIRVTVLLTALRNANLEAVQFPVLRQYNQTLPVADGTVHLLTPLSDQLPPTANIAALRVGSSVCGETWPTMPPIPGWQWRTIPSLAGMRSAGYWCTTQPSTIPAGNSIEFKFKLFVRPTATSIRNALAFQER